MPRTRTLKELFEEHKMYLEFVTGVVGFARALDLLCELHLECRDYPDWHRVGHQPLRDINAPWMRGIEVVDLDKTIASLRFLVEDLERCRDAEQKQAAVFNATRRL